ncbi:GGDEF domain-containing protein, partial [Actinoallomurus acaciae]
MTGEGAERRRGHIPASVRPFGALVALALIYALALGLGWGGGLSGAWLSAWAAAAAASSLMYAAVRTPQTAAGKIDRDMWRWFGVAALAWCAGATVNAVSRLVISRAVVTVSPADLFLLVAPIAITAGFLVPIRLPRSPRPWLRYLADTYVCACALFVVGWVAIFDRLYHTSGESWGQYLIELRYPVLDAALVCVLFPMALVAVRANHRPAALAYCALLVLSAADVVYAVLRLGDDATHGIPADVVRTAGLLLLAAVPWLGRGKGPAEDTPRPLVGPGLAP